MDLDPVALAEVEEALIGAGLLRLNADLRSEQLGGSKR